MPVQDCTQDGRRGYRWGESGTCYTFPAGDEDARREAKRRAYLQGSAIEHNGGERAVSESVQYKGFSVEHKALADKSSEMEEIRQFVSSKDVTEEDIFCGQMLVCNDQYDRAHEKFPRKYLERFAETLPGKSVMPGHDYTQTPLARIYAADVVRRDGVSHLQAKYYADARDERTVRAIQLGVWKDVSVGYKSGGRTCDLCGKDYDGTSWKNAGKARGSRDETEICGHLAGQEYDGQRCTVTYTNAEKAEALEVSIVWQGCQYGARLKEDTETLTSIKALTLNGPPRPEERTMDETEAKALTDESKALKQRLAESEPLAADGRAYRAWLRAEIIRKYEAIGKADTGAILVESLEHAEAAKLQKVADNAQALFDEKFPPSPQSKMLAELAPDGNGAVPAPAGKSLDFSWIK